MDKTDRKIGASELFRTFALLSLCGFGGVAPWVYRVIVEKKKWMNATEFAELLAMGRILPGANVTNFSAMLGYRYRGMAGALASVGGLLGAPFLIVIGAGILYQRYGQLAAVQGALRGVTAVAAGLVLVTGIKLAQGIPRSARALVFGGAAFLAIGIFRAPLGWTMLFLMPAAVALEWRLSL